MSVLCMFSPCHVGLILWFRGEQSNWHLDVVFALFVDGEGCVWLNISAVMGKNDHDAGGPMFCTA